MALNVKLKNENDSSERHNCEKMVALNAKLWGNDEDKYALVWCVVETLDPLKRNPSN